ncbi:MAG: geranylgeranylglyceryl/heptaprenylglyceryl phosphate synthase [Desulfurococcaceae archaeon]
MGKVHDYIVNKINEEGKLHFTLIDPDRVQEISMLEEISLKMVESGTDAFLVGGSTGITPEEAGVVAKVLRKHGLPVIIFPGNINCLTPYADAVLFMVLMNTLEPYYLSQIQILAAPIILKYKLEPLPTAYVVINQDSAVSHIGRVYPIPRNKPELIALYALASEMMGLRYIYIEAGSGAEIPVPSEFPAIVKKHTSLITIVGGGIRSPEIACNLAKTGADIIVTGTIVEKDPELAKKIISSIKHCR